VTCLRRPRTTNFSGSSSGCSPRWPAGVRRCASGVCKIGWRTVAVDLDLLHDRENVEAVVGGGAARRRDSLGREGPAPWPWKKWLHESRSPVKAFASYFSARLEGVGTVLRGSCRTSRADVDQHHQGGFALVGRPARGRTMALQRLDRAPLHSEVETVDRDTGRPGRAGGRQVQAGSSGGATEPADLGRRTPRGKPRGGTGGGWRLPGEGARDGRGGPRQGWGGRADNYWDSLYKTRYQKSKKKVRRQSLVRAGRGF